MTDILRTDVLDHGYVRLVDHMGNDLSVSRAARVSYNGEWRADAKDDKLLNYLWSHKHTSPFEAVTFTFEVKAPIFVLRQWHRHRTWGYNEVSARYTELPEEFYVPKPELYGAQSTTNKQARDISDALSAEGYSDYEWSKFMRWEAEQREHMVSAFALYHKHLGEGMPRELARIVLPMATYSHMFGTVNLLNLFRFLTLRTEAHAQYEIRKYADALVDLAKIVAPVSVAAWEKHPW